jgi:hypothetical protein
MNEALEDRLLLEELGMHPLHHQERVRLDMERKISCTHAADPELA